jgi:hypothetical protein
VVGRTGPDHQHSVALGHGFKIDGTITVVKYDGDEHYRHSLKIED